MYSLSDSTQLFKELTESQELLLVLRFPFILLQTHNLMFLPSSGTTLNEGNCTSHTAMVSRKVPVLTYRPYGNLS